MAIQLDDCYNLFYSTTAIFWGKLEVDNFDASFVN